MLAQQASPQCKELGLVQQMALGLDYLKTRLSPLPEPFCDCILLMSVSTPGEPAATFYVRRPTLAAAWRAGTTQVRQWAWSRRLDCLELRVDWPLEISAMDSMPDAASRQQAASAWAVADESLESVQLLAPQAGLAASSAQTALERSLALRAARTPRPHWLLQLQGLFLSSEGQLASLPRSDAATTEAHAEASLVVLQALAAPVPAQSQGDSAHVQALCARLYALLLVQQHLGPAAAAQRGLAQLLARAAQQLCQQIAQPPPLSALPPQAQPLTHALCLLVLARYAQRHPGERADPVLPLLAQLARQSAARQSQPLQPIARADPSAAWHLVAQAAYADCLAACSASPAPGLDHMRVDAGRAEQDFTPLEAMTRHWLQWHLLAHGGVPAPEPDWTVMAVAELALQPGLAGARRHLQSCSWLASLRQPLQASLPQRIRPETAMFLPPHSRASTAFIEPFAFANPQQASSWCVYQWIQSIFVPQLLDF